MSSLEYRQSQTIEHGTCLWANFSSQIIIRTFGAAKGHNEDPGLRLEQYTHRAVQGRNSFFEHTHMIHVYRLIFQANRNFALLEPLKATMRTQVHIKNNILMK